MDKELGSVINNQEEKHINLKSNYYMGVLKDEELLAKSSSGGAFTAIANYVLDKNGVVFGAALNPDTRKVEHIAVDNKKDLDKLRLSKYYQSEVWLAYKEVKKFIDEGRLVLFTGTACQIDAIYSLCGHSPNLITVDVLCHGVTSKFVVDKYIESQEKKFKKRIKAFYFRVKDSKVGWQSGGGQE